MKVFFGIILFLLINCANAIAQSENASLLLQSPHGRIVKTIWFFKSWEADYKGFDIKRREGLQKEWVVLNKEAIVPSVQLKKEIIKVEADKEEAARIKSVLINSLSQHKIEELDSAQFQIKITSDDEFLRKFSKLISEDYDVALFSGFAYIDHSVTKKLDYEYGLFVHGTDKLLAKANWNYGEMPDLNVINEISSKAYTTKRGVKIFWSVDPKKLKTGYVHGFNIYRDGIRLNTDPIMIPYNNDMSEFEWFDSTANSKIPNQYSIGSESILDIEGIIKAYTYNPAEHPSNYSKPLVSTVSSIGFYFKDGISVNWEFPQESEHYIKGYYIEKDNIPDGYKKVSQLLEPSARSFVDKTASPVNSHLRFKVTALYKDMTLMNSSDKVFSYFPIREPPKPLNFSAKTEFDKKIFKINLVWDPPMSGDTITDYYQLYTFDEINNKLSLNTKIPPIRTNAYNFETSMSKSGIYKFCISAISKSKIESKLSDTIIVPSPTLELSKPIILKSSASNNNINIKWQYTDIQDLKGFRVFQNNILVANEDVLDNNAREITLFSLKPNSEYNFTIQAVSKYNIFSEQSDKATISLNVPQKKK